ncbi:hypothetical protein HDU67_007502 [Dinochytrium kinnereticum]|nr:hypothetical protein HDU67_007502 [Dinochytrium kinnereticum]
MTESKTELLTWVNDLLQIKYTKVEQCGSGDVPLSRVKFASKHEYDFINNLKILQTGFNSHSIEKFPALTIALYQNIPIDKIVKCRYNDNFEFLQWMKKYWDAFYPGGGYDAAARRLGKEKDRPTSTKDKKSTSSASVRSREGTSGPSSPTRMTKKRGILTPKAESYLSLNLLVQNVESSTPGSAKARSTSTLPTPTTPSAVDRTRSRTGTGVPISSRSDMRSSYQSLPPPINTSTSSLVSPSKITRPGLAKSVGSRPSSALGANGSAGRDTRAASAGNGEVESPEDSPSTSSSAAVVLPSATPNTIPKAEHESILSDANKKLTDLQLIADTLERERNFYYLKLRDLEVVVLERYQKGEPSMAPFLREIQTILYSTEEGFISPKKKQDLISSSASPAPASENGKTSPEPVQASAPPTPDSMKGESSPELPQVSASPAR